MGIYPQSNGWECGPFALKYALIVLGIPGDEVEIARVAGTDESGTDEVELGRAARRYGCQLQLTRAEDPATSWAELTRRLRERIPVLLCVNEWGHWVTAAGLEGDEIVILDARDPAVVTAVPWSQLREILVYRDRTPRGTVRPIYDLHPLVPQVPTASRARLSIASVRRLREPENRGLALAWTRYLEDLLAVCDPSPTQGAFTYPLSDILRDRLEDVLRRADALARTLNAPARRRILENVCFVAESYELRVPIGQEDRAVDEVGAILSRRASAALA